MHPILFQLGPLTVRTYGLLVAVGFLAGILLAAQRAPQHGIKREDVLDLGFWAILVGIVGARLLYVAQYPSYYIQQPLRILKVWEGGLVFYGGLLTAVIACFFYLRRHGDAPLPMGDLLAPSISLGQFFGRLGCFFAGCCYGQPTRSAFGVIFDDPQCIVPLSLRGTPLHPVQLYEAGSNLLIFFLLLALDRRKKFAGQIFTLYFILYGISRFLLEYLRADDRGRLIGSLFSPAQEIGLLIVALALAGYIVLAMRARRQA